ncbi:MAG: purine-nucleoside phosphorylase [Deltaproteobacteria bacterium]|nr:MAG: purine-nucleoside phosphorylase [Deltaproteobacteria bacterium]
MADKETAYYNEVKATATWLRKRTAIQPKIGLLTGTGLQEAIRSMTPQSVFDYQQIPHFPLSTVQSHPGRLVFGETDGVPIMAMQGRFHLYEGYSPLEVTFPVRVMQLMGIRYLILTNAAGGLNPDFMAGDIMLITDHINLTGANPLVGPNEDRWGVRFPDMGFAYDPDLLQRVQTAADNLKISVRSGVYAGFTGPSLETPAEIRFLRTSGADAIGFSTVQEVIAAVHGGIRVLGLSTITNVHDPANPVPANVDDIIAVARAAASTVDKLICAVTATL